MNGASPDYQPENYQLSQEVRSRIRGEEIYREEVRRQLEQPKSRLRRLLDFLNAPLGIYLLSSVLISGITYAYTRGQEAKAKQLARGNEIARLTDEMVFRLRQMDDNLQYVVVQHDRWLSTEDAKEDAAVQGRNTLAYRIACEGLGATAKLGGLVGPPGDLGSKESRYYELTIDTDLLFYRQGYKSPDYKVFNLTDLAIRRWKLEYDDAGVSQAYIDGLQNALADMDSSSIALQRRITWTGPYAEPAERINDPHKLALALAPYIDDFQKKWLSLKTQPLLVEVTGDREHLLNSHRGR